MTHITDAAIEAARKAFDRASMYSPGSSTIKNALTAALPHLTGWREIESAPKDGTVIDLWSEEFGRQADCYWGKPSHCCGEAGRYCDDDWHSSPETWVDSATNTEAFSDVTHWMPLPPAPEASHD